MKKVLVGALGMGALVVLLAAAQVDPLAQIRESLANLGLRVDRLEAAAGGGGGASQSSEATTTTRKMVLVSVHLSDHSADNADEIAQLTRECSSLMDTINNAADARATDSGAAIGGGSMYISGGVRGYTTAGNAAGAALGDAQTEQRYSTIRAVKLKRLKALQDAANRPLQLLLGHNGNVVYTLQSKVDLTETLNNIAIGDVITWTGNRLSLDDGAETWQIDSIKKVASK